MPLFVRLQGRPVALVGEGPAADAKRRLLDRAGAVIVGENEYALLAIVANGDEIIAARLKARGVLVNVVDRPDLCDFTLPAIVDRSPVLVAIATGGASAGLAKALRQRLETLLPQQLGMLATRLSDARDAMRARWPDASARRRALDAGLAEGGLLDPLGEGRDVDGWLAGGEAERDRHVTVRLRSDDPDDLTLREARWLGEAERVVVEGLVPQAVLIRLRADAERVQAIGGTGLSVTLVAATATARV